MFVARFKRPQITVYKALAREPEWRTLHGVADGIRPEMRTAFLRAIATTAGAVTLAEVERAIAMGNLMAAEEAIPWEQLAVELGVMSEVVRRTFDRAANASIKYLPDRIQARMSFDLLNPRSVEWIRSNTAELVTAVTNDTKLAIRQTIERAFTEGMHPYKSARYIRDTVGLTERQARAVNNFKNRLIADGMNEAKALSEAEKYSKRLLRDRAENIARTESIKAANMGQQELWRQAADRGLIDPVRVRRVWIVTPDDRLCEFCAPMDGQEVMMEESFASGDKELRDGQTRNLGTTLTPPLHPRCRCAMELRS